ncbi:hypothetical protein T05_14295 [Trichinella murrelli]|uniref:Uncharacterized protein n=1 Tax=Trichinella murrelli TaxID=144512 RepID=A0A0V0TC61_9BILA|nr:hypothetical protein T05_14295 [Trichinella murrelli]
MLAKVSITRSMMAYKVENAMKKQMKKIYMVTMTRSRGCGWDAGSVVLLLLGNSNEKIGSFYNVSNICTVVVVIM